VKNYLAEEGPDGKDRPLPREKFYIPGALLRADVDNTNPLAYGMPAHVDVFFDSSPVFSPGARRGVEAHRGGGLVLRWEVLDSGWAWGQHYLDGGTAVAEASWAKAKWCC